MTKMARSPNVPVSITIVPHDARWPDIYAREANRIRRLLGATALSIDHKSNSLGSSPPMIGS